MARKLSPDGVPIEIPSIRRKKTTDLFEGIEISPGGAGGKGSSGDDPTQVDHEDPTTSLFPDDPPTRPPGMSGGTAPIGVGLESDDRKTRIAGWPRPRPSGSDQSESTARDTRLPQRSSKDPVVGWLVVIDGPGKGSSLRLGMGQNSIGRGEPSRVRINFGDDQISRSGHATITYDPKGNSFHIQPGTGPNLTYLGDDPVLGPTRLPDRTKIALGATTLRFVALCDEGFTWST